MRIRTAEVHHRDAAHLDLGQRVVGGGNRAQEPGGGARRHGDDDVARRHLPDFVGILRGRVANAVGRVGKRLDPLHDRGRMHGARRQRRGNRLGQRRETFAEAVEAVVVLRRAALARARRPRAAPQHRAHQDAAGVMLPLPQPRKGVARAQLFGITGEHAGDERRDQVLRGFTAQAPTGERHDRVVFARIAEHERLRQHAQLAAQTHVIAAEQGAGPLRQAARAAVAVDVAIAGRQAFDEFALQSHFFDELPHGVGRAGEGHRAPLQQEAVAPLAAHLAARGAARFEDADAPAQPVRGPGSRQAGQASADDHEVDLGRRGQGAVAAHGAACSEPQRQCEQGTCGTAVLDLRA